MYSKDTINIIFSHLTFAKNNKRGKSSNNKLQNYEIKEQDSICMPDYIQEKQYHYI